MFLLHCALAMGQACLGQAETDPYQWPLDLPRILTSSFAEYRPGRFHMGIDLRTGPIGQNVYAAGDGHVSRVRCSPYGYGKAIYLSLDDGNSVVYAHLDDYFPELREYVRAAQHRRKGYTVDLYLEPHQFPVSKGDFIANSGQTGIGVPHLHYEFRDRGGAPISPKLLGIEWPDTTSPVIRKIAVVPLEPDTTINGDMLPVVLSANHLSAGQYRTDPIRVRGTVGFAVDLIDPANGGATRLGVHTVETSLDGNPVFRMAHDRVSYSHQNAGAVAYHPYLRDQGRFLVQWRWPGNDVAIYKAGQEDGRLTVPEDAHSLTMTTADFHGNAATVNIPLTYSPLLESLDPPASAATGTGTLTYDTFGEHLLLTARFTAAEPEIPRLTVNGHVRNFRRLDANTFRYALGGEGENRTEVGVLHPRIQSAPEIFHLASATGGTVSTERAGARLVIPADSTFGTLFFQLRGGSSTASSSLQPVGSAVEVWPPDAPLAQNVRVSLPIPADSAQTPGLLIYQRRGSRWSALGSSREGDSLTASTRSFGTFAIMRDTSPPAISIDTPTAGSILDNPRPAIRCTIGDAGSGIAGYTLSANGKWLLAEYDPETNTVEWEQDEDLPVEAIRPGEKLILVLEVSDEAGNIARDAVELAVPAL